MQEPEFENMVELSKCDSVIWGLQNEVVKQNPVNLDKEKFRPGSTILQEIREEREEALHVRRPGDTEPAKCL